MVENTDIEMYIVQSNAIQCKRAAKYIHYLGEADKFQRLLR